MIARRSTLILGAVKVTLASPSTSAQQASPVGVWKTIDDKPGKPKSLIRINEVNGELRGTIEKL